MSDERDPGRHSGRGFGQVGASALAAVQLSWHPAGISGTVGTRPALNCSMLRGRIHRVSREAGAPMGAGFPMV